MTSRPYIEASGDLHGRSVLEWIGKTADSVPPPAVKLRVLLRYERRCHWSGETIRPGDEWDTDHVIAIINGGENRERNLAPIRRGKAHQEKTAEDRDEAEKVDRIRRKHYGLRKPSKAWGKQRGFRRVG